MALIQIFVQLIKLLLSMFTGGSDNPFGTSLMFVVVLGVIGLILTAFKRLRGR